MKEKQSQMQLQMQLLVTLQYQELDRWYNDPYEGIKEAGYDSFIGANEAFCRLKKELENQALRFRSGLNNVSNCIEDLARTTKQCVEFIEKEKEKQQKAKEHTKKYLQAV